MEFGWETWRPDKQDQMPRPDQASITDNGRGLSTVEARFSPVVFPSCLTTGPSPPYEEMLYCVIWLQDQIQHRK
jgi:hypothetical protein